MATIWEKVSSIASALATILSVFALVISVKSCQQSEETLSLQKKEFTSQRLAVWEGAFDGKNEHFSLVSVNKDIVLHSARLTFPEPIYDSRWEASSPNFDIPLLELRANLVRMVKEKVPIKPDYIQVGQSDLPILIEANYIAKGEMFHDRSIYMIRFIYTVLDDVNKTPTTEFLSLRYLYRMKPDDQFALVLNNLKMDVSRLLK